MSSPVAVNLEQVRFSYDQVEVLDIPALRIEAGEHLFIEGPSGCGKSTLLELVAGIGLPQSGSVSVLDQCLNDLNARQRDEFRADHIGLIFQMFNLLPYLSVLENITLSCQFSPLRRQRLREQGSSANLRAKELLDSLGLATTIHQSRSVAELSIGQQQRVAAARALIGSPEILIADEPTSALDKSTRDSFVELLFNECNQHDTTLILVSHDADLGQRFNKRIFLPGINNITPDTSDK